jgi:hypothetical protein
MIIIINFFNLQLLNTILFQYTSYQQGIYYMLGKQVGVVVQDHHDLNHYRNLFEHYKEMLELLMDRYQLEAPDFITFHFKTLHVNEYLIALKKNLSNISLHKGLVKVEKIKQNFNSKVLPYTNKERYLGYLLIEKFRHKYLSDLIALLEKNKFNVAPRTEYPKSFPIEFSNNEKELQKSFGSGLEFLHYVLCCICFYSYFCICLSPHMTFAFALRQSKANVVTDLSMDKLKELMPEKVGKELGQLKFEYKVSKGYFISNKVYALLLNDGTIIKKGKGFSTDSISFSEYEQMYLYFQSIKANKIYGITNYSLGSVLIENKKIIID